MGENVGFFPGVKVDTEIKKDLNKEFLSFSSQTVNYYNRKYGISFKPSSGFPCCLRWALFFKPSVLYTEGPLIAGAMTGGMSDTLTINF